MRKLAARPVSLICTPQPPGEEQGSNAAEPVRRAWKLKSRSARGHNSSNRSAECDVGCSWSSCRQSFIGVFRGFAPSPFWSVYEEKKS